MQGLSNHERSGLGQTLTSPQRDRLREEVGEACKPIALSWPMKTFAYRNPLRGWEHLPFDEAIRQAKHLLGGNGYIPNEDYRQLHREGHVTDAAIDQALEGVVSGLETPSIKVGSRQINAAAVLRLHLLFGLEPLNPSLLTWQFGGGGATERLRDDLPEEAGRSGAAVDLKELWASTLTVLQLAAEASPDGSQKEVDEQEEASSRRVELSSGRTLSDWVGRLSEVSVVDQINEQMIKWAGAFLDEGMADWAMPDRHDGFYRAWRSLAARDWSARLQGIPHFKRKVLELPDRPEDAIAFSLERLAIPESQWTNYLSRVLAQLPGWAGFIRWLGENPSYSSQARHPIDPLQYLAVRLFYEVEFVEILCRRHWSIEGTLDAVVSYWETHLDEYRQLMGEPSPVDPRTRTICRDGWRLFHLAQFLQLTPRELKQLSLTKARSLLSWLDAFPADEHGKVWLEALESSFRKTLIERLVHHQGASVEAGSPKKTEERLRAQIVMCIDARSESFRRYIEDQGPYETFGFAGFFGIPISYQAFDHSERAALCPVIVAPGFEVDEVPRNAEDESLKAYAAGSRWNQLGKHLFHDLKSNPVGSFMLIDILGLFFSLRLAGKTFFRTTYESIKVRAQSYFSSRVATETRLDRPESGQPESSGLPHGFSSAEQATFVGNGLRAIGLTKNFGRFIVLCGHGSTADNNPYMAAYNCGACGGGHGDPNARVFATMGNQPHVRESLKATGLEIPDDTWFLAAKHNTATDLVSFYDVETVPASHAEDLRRFQADLVEAGGHQALERLHRIPQAPRDISTQAAAEHMVSRTIDWANVRPEWGLSSNAAFILGRRSLTKGLNLGSRVFLHSYDPDGDAEGAILEGLMNAPLVVAQWISMEYYFSAVDPTIYGSGSKVTHNVVSGVGVMHGAHGDLQSGLPLQGVNDGRRHYHQPLRLLAIIEAPRSRISAVIDKYELLQHLFQNGWVNLVAADDGEYYRYHSDSTWAPCL